MTSKAAGMSENWTQSSATRYPKGRLEMIDGHPASRPWHELKIACWLAAFACGCAQTESDGSSFAGGGGGIGGQSGGGTGAAPVVDPPGCIGTWTPIATSEPSPRKSHATLWTGTELLIWAGIPSKHASSYLYPPELSDGARYDPVANAFTPLPKTGKSRSHAFVGERQGEMIVFGGRQQQNSNGPYPVLDGFRMDLTTGATMPIDPVPDVDSLFTFGLVGDELVVRGNWSPAVWCRHSLGTSPWSCEPSPGYDAGPPGGWLDNRGDAVGGGEYFTWGGAKDGGTNPETGAFRYSPDTDAWTAMSTVGAPEPGILPSVTWLSDRLFVAGGSANGVLTHTAGFYDPATDTWTEVTPLPDLELGSEVGIVRAGERVVIWSHELARGFVYDMAEKTWTELCRTNAMPSDNRGASADWVGSALMVLGGEESTLERLGARLTLP
jgi:hypothetical protein